eukprot:1517741-Karenia_brevis.AAC.1
MIARGCRNDSMWWICLDCGSRWSRVPMTVGVDGVKPLNSSLIFDWAAIATSSRGPFAVQQSVPMNSH